MKMEEKERLNFSRREALRQLHSMKASEEINADDIEKGHVIRMYSESQVEMLIDCFKDSLDTTIESENMHLRYMKNLGTSE